VALLVVGGPLVVWQMANSEEPGQVTQSSDAASTPTESTASTRTDPTESTDVTQSTPPPSGGQTIEATEYCTEMAALQDGYLADDFENLSNEELDELTTGLEDLRAIAPADIEEEVAIFGDGLRSMHTLLVDIDVTMADLLDPVTVAELAEDWTPTQVSQANQVAAKLQDPEFLDSGEAIDTHYAATC
jgi:hypothetical protein